MEKEINLKHLAAIIRRRLWIVLMVVIISALVGSVHSIFLKTPLYSASARILIQANQDQMSTLRVMIDEPTVLEKVAQELNSNRLASSLSGQIGVENVSGSQIVKITVIDADPALAVKIANTTANIYKKEVANLLNFNNVMILTEAKLQDYPVPININHKKTIMISIIVGLVISIGIIFLLDSLDDSVKSERAIESNLEIPVLGTVSKMNKKVLVWNEREKEKKTVLLGEKAIDS